MNRFMKRTITLLAVLAAASTFTRAEEDTEARLELQFSGQLSETVSVKAHQEWHRSDDISNTDYFHSQAGLFRPLAPWLEGAVLYRQAYSKSSSGWKEENRPMVYLTLKTKLGGWSISDRNRFEYRIRDGRDNIVRYRNKLSLTAPLKVTPWHVQPYFEEEFFIDEVDETINQNRVYLGLKSRPADFLSAKTYFLWEAAKKDGKWDDDAYIAGLALDFSI